MINFGLLILKKKKTVYVDNICYDYDLDNHVYNWTMDRDITDIG